MSAPGYLGLRERTINIGIDWTLVEKYGRCVLVESRSPAAKTGLRSDDYIISINGVTFDEFHKAIPPAGTRFEIVAWRKGRGEIRVFGTLAEVPKGGAETWVLSPAIEPGKPVSKTERPIFIGFISDHPNLHAIDVRLLLVIIQLDWGKGTIEWRSVLANRLDCSIRTVDRATARCRRAGVLLVKSGRARFGPNTYFVTWPANHDRSYDKKMYPTRPTDPKIQAFAEQLLAAANLLTNRRAVQQAPKIVKVWLARGWTTAKIFEVVNQVMRRQRPSISSLRYFEPAIARAHGE